jgi:hypothetical protein
MTPMDKITAIIPTFNEEVHIKDAIESVLWCDVITIFLFLMTLGTLTHESERMRIL